MVVLLTLAAVASSAPAPASLAGALQEPRPDDFPTLAQILRAGEVPAAGADPAVLAMRVNNHAVLDEPGRFLVAFHPYTAEGAYDARVHLLELDRVSGRWRHRHLVEPARDDSRPACNGSVLEIDVAGGHVLVETHVNPSASCTVVLDDELESTEVLYGSALAAFGNGTVVFAPGQVHFAPTHVAEVALYDPASDERRRLHPAGPQQEATRGWTRMLEELYDDEAWCRDVNHHCDPERPNSFLLPEVALDDETDSLAFRIRYELEFRLQEKVRASGGKPVQPLDLLYVYRRVHDAERTRWKEIEWSEVTGRFGDVSMQQVLEPEVLDVLLPL